MSGYTQDTNETPTLLNNKYSSTKTNVRIGWEQQVYYHRHAEVNSWDPRSQ